MGLLWRIGSVMIAACVVFALGLNLLLSLTLCLVALAVLVRQEILDSLFPLRAYQKNCLSVSGLENDPAFELRFRSELTTAICEVFPSQRPTGCCCISADKEHSEATLVLHSSQGHLQIRVAAESVSAVTNRLLEAVRKYSGEPAFRMPSDALLPRCRSCVTRKAHRLINRNYPQLNPLGQASKWGHFVTRLRTLTH